MTIPDQRCKVPVSLLPIDLLVQLRLSPNIDVRRHKESKPSGAFRWTLPFACGLLALGLLEAAFVPDAPPFASGLRWFSLIAGAALLGAWIVWSRIPRFKPERGQGIFVGTASLVIVDDRDVEVLPAEKVAVTDDGIVFEGATVDDGVHEQAWMKALRDAIELSQRDPAAREKDRYRQAAARAVAPRTAPAPSSRLPILIGAGVGLSAALFFEAGPLGARGASTRAEVRAKWEAAESAGTELATLLGPRADQGVAFADKAHAATLARNKDKHDRDLDRALNGTLDDARAFLSSSTYKDKGEHDKVIWRYRELAKKDVASAKTSEPVRKILLECGKYNCDADFEQKTKERFVQLADKEIAAAKTSDDIGQFLNDDNGFDLGEAFEKRTRSKFYALGSKEALGGTLEDVKKYLDNPEFNDAPDRAKVEAKLDSLCGITYPSLGPLAFHAGMLKRLCLAQSKVLTYEIAFGTDADLGKKAADSFAKDLSELSGVLGSPTTITATKPYDNHDRPMIRVSVTLSGVPERDPTRPLTKKQPCTLTVKLLDSSGSPVLGQSYDDKATCTTTETYLPGLGYP